MKTALVTGIGGFLGRHMDAALLDAGHGVSGTDIVSGRDARDYFRQAGERFDVVVHAAAVVGGRERIDGNPLSLAVNLELDAAMFAWAARTRPGRVVYLSSSAAYPVSLQRGAYKLPSLADIVLAASVTGGVVCGTDPVQVPGEVPARSLAEGDVSLDPRDGPDQLYGWAKLTGERLAVLARSEGVPVTVARPFSGYGEDQGPDYPFGAMAARAREHQDPFVIWGTGEQVRDFIHVDDICAAVMAMIREGIDGPVNLGTGRGTSMRELAGMMCAAAGYEPEFKPLPEMPSGVAWRVADVTRMREFYAPEITLEEGVRRITERKGAPVTGSG